MKVVKVYGALRERLGGQGTFELDVKTPAEAIRALCANFEGLAAWFINSGDEGIAYKVFVGKDPVYEDSLERLNYPWSDKEVFKISPVMVGAGGNRGIIGIIIGAALITLAFTTGGIGASLAAGTGFTGVKVASRAVSAATIGASLVLGGVADLLSPAPTQSETPDPVTNGSFSGIDNVSFQGAPVPICYGKCFVGSAIMSAGLDVVQQ